jgi:putative thioredoxin
MNTNTQNYVDVDMTSFGAEVVEASMQQLVMVDFWAEWCAPCRSLGPILEGLVGQYPGALKLVKIDTDAHQELAGQFGIRSLPTVFFFKDGQPVDQFMGVQPESAIKEIIDRHINGDAGGPEGDLNTARQAYDEGQTEEAKNYVRQMVAVSPNEDEAKLLMVEWLTKEGNLDEAKVFAESLSDAGKDSKEVHALNTAIELQESLKDIPPAQELISAIEADENNSMARFQLAQRLVAEQQPDQGMDQLLEIIRRDREFEDDGARKYMIKVFEILGGKGEIVSKYRGLLARTLN